MHEKKLYGTATVGTKGQIVIPADAREELGIQTGDRLYVIGSPEGGMVGLLKEEALEKFIYKITSQVENFKALKNVKDKK
jgi:AbrB family looped-hinge helix DNA binding protein